MIKKKLAATKKDHAKEKARVTIGSEILKRLEQLGPSELLHLKIDELYALHVYADPQKQGSIPKPKKKTWQERANLLPTVQAVLRRILAVAAYQAPPLLLIPFAPVICEEDNISNL